MKPETWGAGSESLPDSGKGPPAGPARTAGPGSGVSLAARRRGLSLRLVTPLPPGPGHWHEPGQVQPRRRVVTQVLSTWTVTVCSGPGSGWPGPSGSLAVSHRDAVAVAGTARPVARAAIARAAADAARPVKFESSEIMIIPESTSQADPRPWPVTAMQVTQIQG